MKNYLLALLIFIGYLSPIQSVIASEDEHEGEEGISKINNNMAKRLGVETAYLASKTLNQTIPVYGATTIGAEQLFQVGARYNGVIKTINSTVGDKVKKGDLLAVIESNESLNTYKITSPVSRAKPLTLKSQLIPKISLVLIFTDNISSNFILFFSSNIFFNFL